jgi:hypothetical protein
MEIRRHPHAGDVRLTAVSHLAHARLIVARRRSRVIGASAPDPDDVRRPDQATRRVDGALSPEADDAPRAGEPKDRGAMTDQARDTFPYPEGSVVAVFTDGTALENARGRLEEAGFDIEVLHGEEGLARIDVAGAAHGRSGSLMRRIQSVLGDEGDHARQYAEHLENGHYVVGVPVGEDEAAKQRAADALGPAETIRYYAESYVEDLR